MARTYRKHKETFNQYYRYWLDEIEFGDDEDDFIGLTIEDKKEYIRRERYKYKTDSGAKYEFGLPKWYRKRVTHQRRSRDKFQLWKELKFEEYNGYSGAYSKWNCKDSNSWGYW